MRSDNSFKLYSILMIPILTLLLTGCQANPEDEIVAGKDAKKFEAILQATEAINSTELSTDVSVNEFPYKMEFKGNTGAITVKVNADVKAWTGNLPVYRVAPHIISQEDVQKWAEIFFEGNPAYDKRGEMSKTEIENYILQLRSEMNDESLQAEYGEDPEILNAAKEYYLEQLALYEELYKTAPVTVERKETSWEFHPSTYYDTKIDLSLNSEEEQELDKTQKLKIEADIGNSIYEIWATNRQADDFMRQSIWFTIPDENYEWEYLSYSEESAKVLVQDTLEALGMNNWKIYSCTPIELENHVAYYHILCQNSYDGFPVTVLPQLENIGGEEYAARYYYESLEFDVSNGKIGFVAWESPMDQIAIENQNVSTLSFEEIMKRFQTQMEVQYTENNIGEGELPENENRRYLIQVNRIEQELVRIKVPDNEKEFYLVPAWNFYGTINGQEAEEEGGITSLDSPLLTLNAVDGTVINTYLGY